MKNLFETELPTGLSRRALLIVPFAFAGLVALSEVDDQPLPDAAANGSGDEVTLVLFSDTGERLSERASVRFTERMTTGASSCRARSSR